MERSSLIGLAALRRAAMSLAANRGLACLAAVVLGICVLIVSGIFRARHATRPAGYKRGTLLCAGRRAQRAGAKLAKSHGTLTLAGVAIPASDETKHFKIVGTTGTGKSTAIRELLSGALDRGDRAIIADPDGGYRARFYDRYRGDVILNPFEPNSMKWDLFAEIRSPYDMEQLASSLIPSTQDAAAQEWRGYARTFLTAIARRCHSRGCRDAAELWHLLAVAPNEELKTLVADTPAQPFLEPDNVRMLGSIRSVAGSALAALEFVNAQRSAPFSIRDWIGQGSGVLFFPYKANQIAALRSMIATWIRLAIFEAMSQRENQDQRLWFVVDELDALGVIDGLKDALARLRKFGGRCVLGFQSISQVSGAYGAGDAQTIVENCGNTLILRCSSSENGGTSQFASRLIGEREMLRRQVSRGRDREGWLAGGKARTSRNISEQLTTEVAVMASEIEQLPDLAGYLKRASSRSWLQVEFGGRSPGRTQNPFYKESRNA